MQCADTGEFTKNMLSIIIGGDGIDARTPRSRWLRGFEVLKGIGL
ncbi:MAG: hypothetical protein Metus_0854 [Candidatus Methanosuratincola subterraneus]|uniref:Uncharacterized protein n=1 Tax=Methanosuratincola subterraneus TaxID=2593994 RepID=A0A444L5N9_METS7|nr:MAG: hypothetical protein Metus_0854 [Candidatus Methanosuratincola subterraneus]